MVSTDSAERIARAEEETWEERQAAKKKAQIQAKLTNSKKSERRTAAVERFVLILMTYPLTFLMTFAALYFGFTWLSYFGHLTYHKLIKRVEKTALTEKKVCKSLDLMLETQRRLIEKAREELSWSEMNREADFFGFADKREDTLRNFDFGFYTYGEGTMDVELVRRGTDPSYLTGSGFTSIIYYRISKAANDQIRAMLFDFAYRNGFHEKSLILCSKLDECINSAVQEKETEPTHAFFFPARLRRFPFTFVREPLERFVAGYREIVFRMPLHSPHMKKNSTADRFKEFVRLILLHNGSRKLFRYPGVQMGHVAPAIATLQQAHSRESIPLRLYHLETFEQDWHKLTDEVHQPSLWQSWSGARQRFPHETRLDPQNSSASAWEFLSPAVNMTMARYRELLGLYRPAADTQEAQRAAEVLAGLSPRYAHLTRLEFEAALYVRALCRIYAADYICGGYPFPPLCEELHGEIAAQALAHEAKENVRAWRKTLVERLLPTWFLFLIAEIPCTIWASDPTECMSRFVFGDEVYEEDNEQLYDPDALDL
jgi:hypothetical protein